MHILFIGILFLFFNNAHGMNENDKKNAMALYAHISDVEYCNQAEEFLDSVGVPFERIKPQDMLFASAYSIEYIWKENDLITTEDFLQERQKVAAAILNGDRVEYPKELRKIHKASEFAEKLVRGDVKRFTPYERCILSYPVSVTTLLKKTGHQCAITVPPLHSLLLTDGFWNTSNSFAKIALKAIKKIKPR